jgi:hypothetical protein
MIDGLFDRILKSAVLPVVALALGLMLWVFQLSLSQVGLERELQLTRQREAALLVRIRYLAADSSLAARAVFPDADSLKAAVSADVSRQLKEQKARLDQIVRVVHEQKAVEADGTVVAFDPEPQAGSQAPQAGSQAPQSDSLRFVVSDTTNGYRVDADLSVDVGLRQLDYRFRVTPPPQTFTAYFVDRGGQREVWVEGPGVVKQIDAYALPETIVQVAPRATWRVGLGASGRVTWTGASASAGVYVGRSTRHTAVSLLAGVGYAPQADPVFSPSATLSTMVFF